MARPFLPLNGLRAFEASARHSSFTRAAATELCVTQAAVSQQVKKLETRLGVQLLQRLPRGLKTTAEGEALLPVVTGSFDQLAVTLERIEAPFETAVFRRVIRRKGPNLSAITSS